MKKILLICLILLASNGLALAVSPWAGTYQGTVVERAGKKALDTATVQVAVFNNGTVIVDTVAGTTLVSISYGTVAPNGSFSVQTANAYEVIPITGTVKRVGGSVLLTYAYTASGAIIIGTGTLPRQH